MKIFISNLQLLNIGGISTSLLNFINELKGDNDITLCILSNYISKDVTLPDGIKVVCGSDMLGDAIILRSLIKNISSMRKIRMFFLRALKKFFGLEFIFRICLGKMKIHENYDVAIAFSNDLYSAKGDVVLGGDYYFILNCINARKKMAWIHNDAEKCGITKKVALKSYRNFDSIVHVSQNNKSIFDRIVPEYKVKSVVIYNMYDIARIKELSNEYSNPYNNNGKVHFVTVCRLYERQKKVSRILEAVKTLVATGYVNFDWKIVGDGDDRLYYEQMLKDYGLQNYLDFVGLKSNPYPYMKYADAFVLTSLYEGFGMSNVESQILTTPALVTDYGAANEVVQNNVNGIICDNSVDGVVSMIKAVLDKREILLKFRKYFIDNPVDNRVALKQFYMVATK